MSQMRYNNKGDQYDNHKDLRGSFVAILIFETVSYFVALAGLDLAV